MLTAVIQVVMGCVVGQHLVWVSEPFTTAESACGSCGGQSAWPPADYSRDV
jgi:hypothetical protein